MRTISSLENVPLERGFEYISDTAAHTGNFIAIQVLTDAVVASAIATPGAPVTGNNFAAVSLPAGAVIYGKFSSITLTSGTVIAYKGVI